MIEVRKPIESEIFAHEISMIRQAIENRRHPLDMVREQISNICSTEVDAKNVKISYYVDPKYGASFIFEDDGCGMNLTQDLEKPGRLDRFINLGYGPIVGFGGDEFSWKGLGAKLTFNSRRIEIYTWTREKEGHHVVIDEPFEKLTKSPPEKPKAIIYELPKSDFRHSGTILKVLGFEDGSTDRDYSLDNIKNFLIQRTLIGCTKERKLPICSLKVLDQEEIITPGYRFIRKLNDKDWRTVVINPPIEKIQRCSDGSEVKVKIKGGFTLQTEKMSEFLEFNMSPKNRNIGIILSVKGIPYFELDYYEFRGNLDPIKRMANIVVECDEIFGIMDLARGDYRREDKKSKAFEKALKDGIAEVLLREDYRIYMDNKRREELKEKSRTLDERKDLLISRTQEFVFIEGIDGPIHKVPDNEHDTLAILWKLEGANKIPFSYFKTLDHTSTRKGGIDLIGHIREEDAGETKMFVTIEVEHTFENFEHHDHYPPQTSYVICWEISDPDILEKINDYKYFKKFDSHIIEVFKMKNFPKVSLNVLEEK